MLRRSIKVMAAAAAFGISPALLTAQSPLDGAAGKVGAGVEAGAQVTPKADAPQVPLNKATQNKGVKGNLKSETELKSKSQLKSGKKLDSQLDTKNKLDADAKAGDKLDTNLDAKSKTKGKLKTPNRTPLNDQKSKIERERKIGPADGAIRKGLPQTGDMKKQVRDGVNRAKRNGANMQKRLKNTPLPPDTKRQTFQGQGKVEIDDMVRQGTAHLDIDDATRARYRHHNGHWWYKTENGQWLIDNNGQWEPFDPVTYRQPNRPMNRNDYQGQGQFEGDFQTYSDDGYYYDDSDYYYSNGYGNRGYHRGNGYYGNQYFNNNRDRYNNNGRWSSGYRGRMNDRRQGAAIGAEIGGSIGGRRGAAIGAGIGAEIAD
ncbi:hypothetical protein Pan241w_49010 [Gimesia alba]|uniref:Uncharacterized protein n=1 Tax=Gimesia alba TaxID=2527973 RepID=A0A517RLN3_9PLAN|nr:hypothetical protein [Gimesia alba]QDT44785.1 hypothetical protein Pan241w_49010 [Gimesia alba]